MVDSILVRFLQASDLPICVVMDPSYHTDFVWQMEVLQDENQFDIRFRERRLPRSMLVEYPRTPEDIIESFQKREAVLVGLIDGETVGFISILAHRSICLAQVTDLVINRRFRRRGVGARLVQAAQSWTAQNDMHKLQIEMQSKNYPAIELANHLGFEFSGYNDRYYKNQDIALYFVKRF